MAIVEMADSDRLNVKFSRILAELRLACGLLQDPAFLHGPYVVMNQHILQLFESGKLAECAAAINYYLAQFERIVPSVWARQPVSRGVKR